MQDLSTPAGPPARRGRQDRGTPGGSGPPGRWHNAARDAGSADRLDAAGRRRGVRSGTGWECLSAPDANSAREVVGQLGGRRLDVYVQLPAEITSTSATAIGRVGDLLREGLVARFDAAATAVAAMGEGATVILVAGNSPGDRPLTDDQRARYALLRVLGHAVLADSVGRSIRSIVLPAATSDADIVSAVLEGRAPRDTTIADFVDAPSELSYADWRVELLALATNES